MMLWLNIELVMECKVSTMSFSEWFRGLIGGSRELYEIMESDASFFTFQFVYEDCVLLVCFRWLNFSLIVAIPNKGVMWSYGYNRHARLSFLWYKVSCVAPCPRFQRLCSLHQGFGFGTFALMDNDERKKLYISESQTKMQVIYVFAMQFCWNDFVVWHKRNEMGLAFGPQVVTKTWATRFVRHALSGWGSGLSGLNGLQFKILFRPGNINNMCPIEYNEFDLYGYDLHYTRTHINCFYLLYWRYIMQMPKGTCIVSERTWSETKVIQRYTRLGPFILSQWS